MRDLLENAVGRTVSRETYGQVSRFTELLRSESQKHNLVARSTLDTLWERHIADSAQLARLEPAPGASWIDVGSGAGLPGLVIAALVQGHVTMVEPRRLRAEFLVRAVSELGLANRTSVIQSKVEQVQGQFDVITGRAVASLGRFLDLSQHLSTKKSVWILPKGRSAQSELAEARRNWHCDARAEPSRTDPDAEILVLTRVGTKTR